MSNKTKGWKRWLSLVLAVHMTLSNVPLGALAQELGEEDCAHHSTHTAQCGYVEAVAEVPCGHSCEEEECTHIHDETCGYVAAVEGSECGFVCPVCPVQGLIDTLPKEVTEENVAAVTEQLAEIDAACEALTGEEVAQLDFGRYETAKTALEELTTEETEETTEATEETIEATEESVSLISGAEPWDTDKDGILEILAIGNSFSVDALEYTYQIAHNLGIQEIAIGNLYIGGCTLETHAANAAGNLGKYTYYYNDNGAWTSTGSYKISTALASRSWDYVSLQQGSPVSGVESSYNKDLTDLITYVKDRSDAKLVWHMTWAYQQNSTHSAFPTYGKDQMTMYNAIVSAVQNKIVTNSDFDLIVPNGTAVQNSRTSLLGDTTTRDGYHMSKDYGRYLTGLLFIKTVTGLSVDGITYAPSGVDAEKKAIAIESVNNAFAKPFAVTQSAYVEEEPEVPGEGYILLQPELYKGAYWHPMKDGRYNALIDDLTNSNQFFATIRFTREELPVGSIIMLEKGWQYRPDGWVTDTLQTGTRESVTTEAYVVVTEEWWENYTIRSFNISRANGGSVLGLTEDEMRAIFRIYVPKEAHTHTYASVVTVPTCTEKGYTTYTCACGDSYDADEVAALGHSYENGICTGCGETLAGKTVSILGHSMSTYAGVSNNTADNSTIGKNDVYYTEGKLGVYRKDTWWQQAIDALRMELLVNNSWSGSCVFMPRKGEASVGYGDRAVNLHNDHTGEEPDIIWVYIGCNDFAYYQDTFGKAADVDYAALIRANGDGTYTYAEPQTACEAYAIMLHKVHTRYPGAEIYCITSTARRDPDYADNYADTGQPTAYMAQLHGVANHFGFSVVDLEDCIPKEAEEFDKYIGDKRAHANTLGMDKITNAVLSVMLDTEAEICHVTSKDGIVAEQAVLLGGGYYAIAELREGYSAVVTMNGEDITDEVFQDRQIAIAQVTGDIEIHTAQRQNALSFRWEMADNQLESSGETTNTLTKLSGTVTEGVLQDSRYQLGTEIILKHDRPWELEWKFAGDWRGPIFASDLAQTTGMLYLTRTKGGQLCLGTWTGKQYDNYGVDISNLDDQPHTFRLVNRIAEDGSNMVVLYVDGAEIGPMNHYFVGSKTQNKTSNWVSGKDFVFCYMGMEGHAIDDCAFEYLAVWEGGKPEEPETLAGKTISILGDSISTYTGVSNNTAYNSTIGSNDVYYTAGKLDVYRADTWWQQTIDLLDLELLVNNSWSGSTVFYPRKGAASVGYGDRCVNLHNDKTGEEPDIIAVFLGTNDFSYYQSTLGTADIDYDALITDNGDGTFAYATPTTTCEAYAIMLHKMQTRYPDAEILCMTLLPRRDPDKADSYADVGQPTAFNAELAQVIAHFGCTLVDLENCGIDKAAATFDTYITDQRVHPGPAGMDKMTLAVIDVLMDKENASFLVTCDLANVNADVSGGIILSGEAFSATLNAAAGFDELNVTVTMGGTDITESCYADGKVTISSVTGDVVITASAEIDDTPKNYRWELSGSNLACTEGENALTKKAGTVAGGVINNAYFQLERPVILRHDQSWVVEWKASGSWSGMLFSAEANAATTGNNFLFKTTSTSGFVGFGERTSSQYKNYGIALGALGVDTTAEHVYHLENRIAADGSNMAYLLVDGVEMGSMNNFFIGGTDDQGKTVDWLNGRDFCFFYVGASSHTINNCALEYLAVWEGGKPEESLAGKTISILGASMSTYEGTSNGAAADTTNSTIRNNAKYYPHSVVTDVTLNDTWWMQVASDMGLRLLVNNSWSGSSLLYERGGTAGAYVDRCVQLHDDTGDNAGEMPDIIGIQMGTNDFQYYKDTLGTADIDYETLITDNGDGTYTYATPVTSLEAAAIVLHKISVRYPDAEVYYLNISQRIDGTDELIQSFNAELKQVVEYFGAHIVDIYGSAITMENFSTYIGDGRVHPNKLGMDAYAEAFKRTLISNTAYIVDTHTVDLELDDVTADYGDDKIVVSGDAFTVKLTAVDSLEVYVTMGGEDITESAYANGTVSIPAVTADVTVSAKSVYELNNYRWEFDGTELAGENTLTKLSGTTTDGVFSNTSYSLAQEVLLLHDQPWTVEWVSEGTFQNSGGSTGARIFTSDKVNANYNARYIFKSNKNGIVAMGEKTTSGSQNYGIALGDHGIDWTAEHTYRLENRIAADGSNMIYLFVDGTEIGPMNHHYVGTTSQNATSDWLSGKDFVFPYMGTDTHGFTNCSIDYIAVWEGGHTHSYEAVVTVPTCTEQGYTTYTCACGGSYVDGYVDANGHSYIAEVTKPTCTEQGYTTYICDLCGDSYVDGYVDAAGHSYEGLNCAICGAEHPNAANFEGKVISILSASTSTFAGYIPVADGFNLEHRARYPQDDLLTDVNETWWMQLIHDLDAKLGINDSWAGSQVLNTRDTNSGDLGPDAAMASLTRVQNLGANGTPDVILFFGGINDMGRGVTLGSFDPATAPTEVDLTATKWSSFADAYVAAIMRLQYFYPNSRIVVMSTYPMPSYATEAKLNKYGPVIQAICDHYGVECLSLRDCGVTFDMLPDDIHPNAEGMDHITNAVLAHLLEQDAMEPGENVVYSVTHDMTDAKASLGYYKGISAGKTFEETLSGDNLTVSVSMGGKDITDSCYADGKISIASVTGDIVITAKGAFDADGHLQQLPERFCPGTNLWTALEPENIYYTVNGWGLTGTGKQYSVTFPVKAGDQIWATSFGTADINGFADAGVRITWFSENGVLDSMTRERVYEEYAANGYVTAPEGAVALNVPMASNANTWELYILTAEHNYESVVTAPTCTEQGYTTHTCTICGDSYVDSYVDAAGHSYEGLNCAICGALHPNAANFEGKVISILGDSISTFDGYIPVADGFNLWHDSRYPQDNLLTDVNETWWMQVLTELDAKLGINESWRSTEVYNYIDAEVNNSYDGTKACMASTTRIQNLGSNGTPDLILFFGGTNDITQSRPLGTFDPATAPTEVDLTSVKWETVADAYVDAIMRMQHYYPDAEIVSLLPFDRNSQGTTKVNNYNSLFISICEHYGVPYVDLRECGISNADLPDGTHPDATGMDCITDAVLAHLLEQDTMEPGENVVYSVTHDVTGVKASLGYYKGISAGKSFVETLSGDNLTVSVSMGGKDITASAYAAGVISIPAVTGDLVITAESEKKSVYADHLHQLPDSFCPGTNLWTALEPENIYYTADGWGQLSSGKACSVTIPIAPGDRLWATSFQAKPLNGNTGSSSNGIRVTFFDSDGVFKALAPADTYKEFTANGGYLIAPEGAVAVNVPMWTNDDSNELYILTAEHNYESVVTAPTCTEDGYTTYTCTICGDSYVGDEAAALDHTAGEAVKENETVSSYESVVYCTVCDAEISRETISTEPEGPAVDKDLTFVTKAINLAGYIGAQFEVNPNAITAKAYDSVYVVVVKNGIEYKLEDNIGASVNRYVYEYALAAKEMTEQLTLTAYAVKDNVVYKGETTTWCIRDGAWERLDRFYPSINGANGEVYKNRCILLVDMLNYGAHAQIRFNYNTDNLANAQLKSEYAALATVTDPDISAMNTAAPKTVHELYQYNLGLEAQVDMQFVFRLASTNYSEYSVKIVRNGVTYEYGADKLVPLGDNLPYVGVVFDQMESTDMRETVTVELYQNGVKVSQTYTASIEGIAKIQIDAGKNVDLLKAMMRYGDSAVVSLKK